MEKSLRKIFNENYSEEKYHSFLEDIHSLCKMKPDFRVAETPVFISNVFKDKMLDTCESIIDFILEDNFKALTENSIPEIFHLPNENQHPEMLVFDFGICENNQNEIEPQLIEMQGFPSIYGFQIIADELYRKTYNLPEKLSSYLNGYNKESYIELLKSIIFGDFSTENVILLEIEPEKQKTKIDFYSNFFSNNSIACPPQI
mgnify:CR=1 FL=1